MFFEPTLVSTRWVAYFDLLGTKDLLARGEEVRIFHAYTDALDKLRRDGGLINRVKHAWFSDTFLIIAPDDSGESFVETDLVARSFAYFLLCEHVPLRGAISCGRMYADFDGGIYFGLGMVEAYEYGEGQNWIGLVLCQSAMSRLVSLGVSLDNRLNWQLFEVPWTTRPKAAPDQLPACIIGQSFRVNGRNPCLKALKEMLSAIDKKKPRVHLKYSRAIEFIETYSRTTVQNS